MILTEKRDGAFKCVSKLSDVVLVTEGTLEILEGFEFIECHDVVDSDHRGFSIDLNLEVHFDEDFSMKNEREQRFLNPSKRSHT